MVANRRLQPAQPVPGQLRWTCCDNARDLGGLPTPAGPTQRARLFRSANLVGRRDQVLGQLEADGISRVIDLRSAHEAESMPSPLQDHAIYSLVPMIDPRMDHLRDPTQEQSLLDTYVGSIDRNARTIGRAIASVVDAPPGGVLLHCLAGKDRTGIVTALILRLVGVPVEPVLRDFAASQDCLKMFFAHELAACPDEAMRERLRSRQHSRPKTMRGLLNHIDKRYGDPPTYACKAGVTPEDLSRLRRRLISPSAQG